MAKTTTKSAKTTTSATKATRKPRAKAEPKAPPEPAPEAPAPAADAAIDLDTMTRDELEALRAGIDAAIEAVEADHRAEAIRAAEAAAGEMGFRLRDLVGDKRTPRTAPVPPKYRHPENPDVTWSGRGRKPRWFTDALERGETAEGMKIGPGVGSGG